MTVSVKEAKNRLTELLVLAESGESVTIERHGKPIVELVKATSKKARKPGTLAGKKVILDPHWDRPQSDLDAWLAGDV